MFSIKDINLFVDVKPGNILLTVILNCPSSLAMVFAHDATAPLVVLETPRLSIGIFTDVEITLMMRPYPSFFMEGTTAFVKI